MTLENENAATAHVRRVAESREELHADDPSGRQLTRNTHETGLRGEFAFGELVGYFPDTSGKRDGDNGIDFVLPVLMSVDVKTRRERPGEARMLMLVEEGKAAADIYVCCILSCDETRCEPVGWMHKTAVLKYPVGDLGTGVKNHQVPVADLHPMETLTARIANWRNPKE